uniref:Uncharacterized protein n=1 Tax=Amphimedon queenslandica TaxID=400682 RepID=A0A1X7V5T9_AMPQE
MSRERRRPPGYVLFKMYTRSCCRRRQRGNSIISAGSIISRVTFTTSSY